MHPTSASTGFAPASPSASPRKTHVSPATYDDVGESSTAWKSGQLRIYTLGRFDVLLPESAGGREALHGSARWHTLLKYLVATMGQRRSCEQAIEALWPGVDPERGRQHLRDAVSRLRRALEPAGRERGQSAYLIKNRATVGLLVDPDSGVDAGVWVDAVAFERLATGALKAWSRGEGARSMAEAAITLYQGPFLPAELRASWADQQRGHYRRLWAALVRNLVRMSLARGSSDHAILLLGRLIYDTPDDEDAVSMLMVILAAKHRRSEALRLYQSLKAHLRTSLGTPPAEALRALAAAIRAGDPMDRELAQLL
jgi:DNA-binding SARP family transcriptional activator